MLSTSEEIRKNGRETNAILGRICKTINLPIESKEQEPGSLSLFSRAYWQWFGREWRACVVALKETLPILALTTAILVLMAAFGLVAMLAIDRLPK